MEKTSVLSLKYVVCDNCKRHILMHEIYARQDVSLMNGFDELLHAGEVVLCMDCFSKMVLVKPKFFDTYGLSYEVKEVEEDER